MKADIWVVAKVDGKNWDEHRFNADIVKFWSSRQGFLKDGREVVFNTHKDRWEYHPQ